MIIRSTSIEWIPAESSRRNSRLMFKIYKNKINKIKIKIKKNEELGDPGKGDEGNLICAGHFFPSSSRALPGAHWEMDGMFVFEQEPRSLLVYSLKDEKEMDKNFFSASFSRLIIPRGEGYLWAHLFAELGWRFWSVSVGAFFFFPDKSCAVEMLGEEKRKKRKKRIKKIIRRKVSSYPTARWLSNRVR